MLNCAKSTKFSNVLARRNWVRQSPVVRTLRCGRRERNRWTSIIRVNRACHVEAQRRRVIRGGIYLLSSSMRRIGISARLRTGSGKVISGSMFNSASGNGVVEALAAANAFPIRRGAWHTRPIYLAALRFVYDHLWRSFAHFNLGAHLLDLSGLLFDRCG